jgi:amino acid transporter
MGLLTSLFVKKPIKLSLEQNVLARTLSLRDVFGYGIASTIGTGIYFTIGDTAREYAGPSIVVSLALAGVCALMSGLCFLELASKIPSAGSGMCGECSCV